MTEKMSVNEKIKKSEMPRPHNKWMRNASIFVLVTAVFVMLSAAWVWLDDYLHPNAWLHGIGMFVGGIFFVLFVPAIIAGACGLRYYEGKSKGELTACWVWGCVALAFYVLFLLWILSMWGFNISGNDVNGFVAFVCESIVFAFVPIILFLVGCDREKSILKKKKKN